MEHGTAACIKGVLADGSVTRTPGKVPRARVTGAAVRARRGLRVGFGLGDRPSGASGRPIGVPRPRRARCDRAIRPPFRPSSRRAALARGRDIREGPRCSCDRGSFVRSCQRPPTRPDPRSSFSFSTAAFASARSRSAADASRRDGCRSSSSSWSAMSATKASVARRVSSSAESDPSRSFGRDLGMGCMNDTGSPWVASGDIVMVRARRDPLAAASLARRARLPIAMGRWQVASVVVSARSPGTRREARRGCRSRRGAARC